MTPINHLATIVAAIAQFCLGAGWYTLFSKEWLAAIGKTADELAASASALPYAIAVVASLVVAYAIAWSLPRLGSQTVGGGIRVGVLLALTLIATTLALNYGFEQRSVALWLINAGYMTVGMGLMGAIIGGWRKKTP